METLNIQTQRPGVDRFELIRLFNLISVIWLAGSLVFLSSTNAFAGDKKSYPAQMCQELRNGESGDISRSEYRLARTRNSTGVLGGWVICPIVRDTFSGSWGGPAPGLSVDVYVTDQHPLNVECALVYQNFDGSNIRYRSASSSGFGKQKLPNMWLYNAFGVYQVKCRLPPHGIPYGYTRFHSYVVYE